MERRVLLAISLSFLVLFVYQSLVVPPVPPEPAPASLPAPQAQPDKPVATSTVASSTPPDVRAPADHEKGAGVAVKVGEGSERHITVETRTVRAVFSNRGGRLTQWILKDYQDEQGRELNLIPDPSTVQQAYTPFSLRLDDPDLTSRVNGGLYRSDAPERVDATSSDVSLVFEWEDASGLTVKKAFTLSPAGYLVTAAIDVRLGQEAMSPVVEWGPGLGDEIANAPPGSFLAPSYSIPAQALVHRDGSVQRQSQAVPGVLEGPFLYAGIDDHYFAALVVSDRNRLEPIRFDFTPFIVPPKVADQPPGRYAAFGVQPVGGSRPMRFFVGPKALDELRAVDTELVRVINFGMFSWLAVPLLGAMKWVYQYVGNWGWSIIWLTVLINLAMFPLRHKAVTSMRKMQEIQPQMKAIQERYAKYKITDPQRQKMNQEVMDLYKAKGVNPASGCVPMLLTFPFLFAFYAMLSQAIEIRGADFLGWISDLSRPDPWYITPLLMGATMFWQQKITPTSMDPVQQRVMMIMPIMFTFMFLAYPSGLVIYWTMSNLWAIGQQYFTNWLLPLPAAKAKS
jgi:YidC/Oxa1 family membrane protein insertase